jgi:hypothetical protein
MATQTSDRYTALPTEAALADTAAGLERRGFGVEVVEDLDAARRAVLARIPAGASVMTYPSVTLEETGIARAIDEDGSYDSVRVRGRALDRATQMHEIKALMLLPDFALGSVHAVTRDGTLLLASALGSQVAAHAWGARQVIFAVGAQKLVPDVAAGRERIRAHCLPLESERALAAYGEPSRIGKILEIHQEDPGRIHVVLIRRRVGF